VASGLIAIFTTPQLINLIKTRNTTYINIPMYSIYLIGCFCFLIGGVLMVCGVGMDNPTLARNLSSGLPLVIAQSFCGIISSIIFTWKIKNYLAAKRAKITELQYCKQLKSVYDEYKRKVHSLSHVEKQDVQEVKEEGK
jgi:uncharacterized protein with PQ loop repeat